MNEDNKVIENNESVPVNNDLNNNLDSNIEEVNFNYSENDNNISNVNASTNNFNNNVIEEVSIVADSTSLDEVKSEQDHTLNNDEVVVGSLKEGREHLNEKKGFPYGMIIIFVVFILCAVFIDHIVGFFEDVIIGDNSNQEENVDKDDSGVEENNK